MIVLDTNVASELMRPRPQSLVQEWTLRYPPLSLYATAVTFAEIRYGIERLPPGRNRDRLSAASTEVFASFSDKVLPFDQTAAEHYGDIVATRERAGRPIGVPDAQIAAICRAAGASLATRNRSDFEGTGIELVDPWASAEA